jgi:UDP-2,3-diacylglucosamine hydrolase
VPCFVQHGNRDFLLGERFGTSTGCRLLADPVVADLAGTRVMLTHGDLLCTDDHKYQELRTIVRDPEWQQRFLALSLADRQLFANEARAGSRAHTGRVIPQIMDANAAAIEAAAHAADAAWIIHGHTHRPGVHEFAAGDRRGTRIVLGPWYETGSVLEWRREGYALRDLPRS